MNSVERAMRGVVFTGAQQIELMEFYGTGTPYDALRRLKIFCDDRIALLSGDCPSDGRAACCVDGGPRDCPRCQSQALARAREFSAWKNVNPRSNDPVGAIKDLTHGGADFALDTSSRPDGRIAAARSAKVPGTVRFVGECNKVKIDVSPEMLPKQQTVIGSWTFSW
jgi:(R,R)-butanediol dehydrogenase/meso-butanediol dehydrogenase/diacetyl reductase